MIMQCDIIDSRDCRESTDRRKLTTLPTEMVFAAHTFDVAVVLTIASVALPGLFGCHEGGTTIDNLKFIPVYSLMLFMAVLQKRLPFFLAMNDTG